MLKKGHSEKKAEELKMSIEFWLFELTQETNFRIN